MVGPGQGMSHIIPQVQPGEGPEHPLLYNQAHTRLLQEHAWPRPSPLYFGRHKCKMFCNIYKHKLYIVEELPRGTIVP